ncbi:hypothetical protein ACFUMJ_25520 [Streptomyces olivaceus]
MCGGTHVEHASQIGTVALTSESWWVRACAVWRPRSVPRVSATWPANAAW